MNVRWILLNTIILSRLLEIWFCSCVLASPFVWNDICTDIVLHSGSIESFDIVHQIVHFHSFRPAEISDVMT